MEDKEDLLMSILRRVEEYVRTSLELIKLQTIDKTLEVLSSTITRLAALLLFFMFIIMASVGVSLWLGAILNNIWHGFFIVAGFYFITGLICFFFNKPLKRLIGNFFVKQVFN